MSTLQPTSSSPRLTNKSRKNPQPAPIRQPANRSIWPVLFCQICLPGRQSASPSSFLACCENQKTNPHVGGASAAAEADLCPETESGKGLCPGTGTTNHQDRFLGQGAARGLLRENKDS
ncbi:hypothetical protein DPEC_G00211980 [Dallia pectoralis]|uniref:Uncharacterized protein n=1 Tax=Dallia pectoralis TaxID=75939 RepID=A0ACC2G6C7_DALPE|nr:hypothetical protein DPEC_G00211980 [Dallia pectoralis]